MVLCLLAVTTALAQAIQVKGIVYDGNGETMPGVNVHVKGAASGTITDVNGNYTVSVPNSNSILVFSFIGYLKSATIIQYTIKGRFMSR